MAVYPPDRFVQEFAKRTHQNLRDIKAGRQLSYEDTALISSLLAVFVLPHERADDESFIEDLLSEYNLHELEEIVKILIIEVGATEESVPKSIGKIPKFLRHAVAHLNIKPQSSDGQSLTHLLIWNRKPGSDTITFVASVHVRRLRSLALHVLDRLSKSELGDKYDSVDPIAKFDAGHAGFPVG